MPSRVRIVVDFPAPFGPINPKNSPSDTVRSKPEIPLASKQKNHDGNAAVRTITAKTNSGDVHVDFY